MMRIGRGFIDLTSPQMDFIRSHLIQFTNSNVTKNNYS